MRTLRHFSAVSGIAWGSGPNSELLATTSVRVAMCCCVVLLLCCCVECVFIRGCADVGVAQGPIPPSPRTSTAACTCRPPCAAPTSTSRVMHEGLNAWLNEWLSYKTNGPTFPPQEHGDLYVWQTSLPAAECLMLTLEGHT